MMAFNKKVRIFVSLHAPCAAAAKAFFAIIMVWHRGVEAIASCAVMRGPRIKSGDDPRIQALAYPI